MVSDISFPAWCCSPYLAPFSSGVGGLQAAQILLQAALRLQHPPANLKAQRYGLRVTLASGTPSSCWQTPGVLYEDQYLQV